MSNEEETLRQIALDSLRTYKALRLAVLQSLNSSNVTIFKQSDYNSNLIEIVPMSIIPPENTSPTSIAPESTLPTNILPSTQAYTSSPTRDFPRSSSYPAKFRYLAQYCSDDTDSESEIEIKEENKTISDEECEPEKDECDETIVGLPNIHSNVTSSQNEKKNVPEKFRNFPSEYPESESETIDSKVTAGEDNSIETETKAMKDTTYSIISDINVETKNEVTGTTSKERKHKITSNKETKSEELDCDDYVDLADDVSCLSDISSTCLNTSLSSPPTRLSHWLDSIPILQPNCVCDISSPGPTNFPPVHLESSLIHGNASSTIPSLMEQPFDVTLKLPYLTSMSVASETNKRRYCDKFLRTNKHQVSISKRRRTLPGKRVKQRSQKINFDCEEPGNAKKPKMICIPQIVNPIDKTDKIPLITDNSDKIPLITDNSDAGSDSKMVGKPPTITRLKIVFFNDSTENYLCETDGTNSEPSKRRKVYYTKECFPVFDRYVDLRETLNRRRAWNQPNMGKVFGNDQSSRLVKAALMQIRPFF